MMKLSICAGTDACFLDDEFTNGAFIDIPMRLSILFLVVMLALVCCGRRLCIASTGQDGSR